MSRFAKAAFKGLEGLAGGLKAIPKAPAPEPGKIGKTLDVLGLSLNSPGAAAWALPTAGFVGGLAQPLVKGVSDTKGVFNKELDEEIRRRRLQVSQQLKAQRLQQAMADNMMRLAAANPQLYNQLLVGRTLPQGAVVIGGGQRSDFLESVAYQMATGGFGNPQGTPDSPDVMQSLIDSY
jgi:hypothetical protein